MNLLKAINQNSLEKIKPFIVIGIHLLSLVIVFHFLSYWEFFRGLGGFKQWDAFWYESIALNGYEFKSNEASSCGFFPLFSFVWRLMPFGNKGVVFVNFSFFILGLLLLKRSCSLSNMFLLLCLSIPSMMFMYVPYTEALFFLTTSVFMYGLLKNDARITYIGLFLASCTRPTAVFFIPAIIFMELMHHKDVRTTILNISKYALTSVAGIFVVLIIQFAQTGVWFAYFKAQANSWNREFQIPELPFTTWDGTRILWIDGIALMFGCIAFGLVFYILFKKLIAKKNISTDKATLFGICYVVMAALSVIFFNGKDVLGGTSLMGANRYIMASPCFILLLNYLASNLLKEKVFIFISAAIALICAFMLGLGSIIKPYNHTFSNNYILLIYVYVLTYLLLAGKYKNTVVGTLYLVNIFAQVQLISHFSNGLWVG